MSLDDETVVDESTEIEENLEQTTEEVASEQSESEEGQGVATENQETEQTGETEDDFNLSDVLSGKTESEEKESKVPRSTRRLLRKNSRLEKELADSQRQVDQLTNQQPANVQAQAPERDWENETDEQYNFRSMNVALDHRQQQVNAGQQRAQQVQVANDGLKEQRQVIEKYSDEVDKLNLPNYDDAESRVLDMMPEGSLTYMSKMNPAMTARIIYHLDLNPSALEEFARLAHTDANGFNRSFGMYEAKITSLEKSARSKHKKVSKAQGDKALDGSGSQGTSLDKKMQAAADKGSAGLAEYRKLRAQRNK